MKLNQYNLKKLETLIESFDYSIRYGQGNFQSGYCLVKDRKVVVINRFFDVRGRINVLTEILIQHILPNNSTDGKDQKYILELKSWYGSGSLTGR